MIVQDIWNKGVPLQQAFQRLCPQELLKNYRGFQISSTEICIEAVQMFLAPFAHGLEKAQELQEQKKAELDTVSNAEFALKDFIESRICSREYIVSGFCVPSRPDDIAITAPDDLLIHGKLDYEKGEYKNDRLHMMQVRITPVSWLDSSPDQRDANPKGRPTKAAMIRAAIQSLHTEGKLDHANTRADNALLTLKMVHQLYPETIDDETGLQSQTINKYLREHDNTLK